MYASVVFFTFRSTKSVSQRDAEVDQGRIQSVFLWIHDHMQRREFEIKVETLFSNPLIFFFFCFPLHVLNSSNAEQKAREERGGVYSTGISCAL